MNRLPVISDDEFYGTLLNALHVAKERYIENMTELREAALKPGTPDGARFHYNQLADQFDAQVKAVEELMAKFEDETTDA